MSWGAPAGRRAGGPPPLARRGPGRLGRVLLADDDWAAAKPLADTLRAAGFYVRLAGNGQQALRRLCAEPFELVITDIVMPEMDGLELLGWLRRLQRDVPAIALSGDGPDAGALYAKAALCFGADVTLPGPTDPRVVLAAAHRLTGEGRGVPAALGASAPAA